MIARFLRALPAVYTLGLCVWLLLMAYKFNDEGRRHHRAQSKSDTAVSAQVEELRGLSKGLDCKRKVYYFGPAGFIWQATGEVTLSRYVLTPCPVEFKGPAPVLPLTSYALVHRSYPEFAALVSKVSPKEIVARSSHYLLLRPAGWSR